MSTHPSPHQQPPYGFGPPMYPPPPPPPALDGPPPEMLGNQGARLAARFLDGVFMLLAGLLVAGVVTVLQNVLEAPEPVEVLIGFVGYGLLGLALLCYEPVMIWERGATYGKRICGLRVARVGDGEDLSFRRAWLRWFMSFFMGFVPFLGLLDGLWCLWDKPFQQCLHDKAADSVVLTTKLAGE
ncbi:RDD family protein [Streptomyces sp. NPDC056600]|uniref:RDD family protein n=1 Tax=Streptomyces sp. NPDC056600 TaxID=3345874 RepID=UPI0036C7F575